MTSLARQFSRHDSYTPDALGVDLGRQLILDTVRPVSGGEHVALHNALGRVLAETILSPIDVPAHDNSAMDGYGLRADDLAADGDTTLDELDASGPIVVVVGSEGKGLSRLVRENCDAVVSIPMAGPTESLNAAVAAGVVLAEVARQRRS